MFKDLVTWSKREFSELPWRRDHDPYHVLVSEIMLQQTTVGTVLNHYDRFLQEFPNVTALAKASEEQVLVAWKGLGYYRRAKNLRQACIDIVQNHQGIIPRDLEGLLSIKGIGDYTARALLAFSYNEKALAVDANIERVIARLFTLDDEKGVKLQKKVRALFDQGEILKKEMKSLGAGDLNAALMDLGRVYCQARRADCALCPLRRECNAFAAGNVLQWPRMAEPSAKASEKHELHVLRVYYHHQGKVAGIRREEGQWLAGQYELPTYVIESTDTALKQYPRLSMKINYGALPSFKSTITKYKITNYILVAGSSEFKKFKIQQINFLDASEQRNLSSASLKAIKAIQK